MPALPILALDTSTSTCSLAIGDDRSLLYDWSAWAPRGHSEMLHPAIQAAFEALGWSAPLAGGQQPLLEGVAVTTGPGSFTGLRIGIAAAKGLSHAWCLPLVGLPTLQIMAWGLTVAKPGRLVLAAIPSRRQDCYAAIFRLAPGLPGGLPEQIGDIVVAPADDAFEHLVGRVATEDGHDPELEVVLCGAPWRDPQTARPWPWLDGVPGVSCTGVEHDWPRARDLAGAAAVARRDGQGGPPESVTPQYIRRPGLGGAVDAEPEAEARTGGRCSHAGP